MIYKIINLIRVRQWYKNLVVFLAIFFVGNLFNYSDLLLTIVGFFSLCFVSSGNYIINDLVDFKKDQHHPEKKFRPLASGDISKKTAIIISILLYLIGILLAIQLSVKFLITVILLFLITQIYSFYLKKILIADILTISTLFVLRSLSGAYIINEAVSYWLILCPFFLSLFLSVSKRHGDLILLKEEASKTKSVLKGYTMELTNSIIIIVTTLLLMSYTLYSFLSGHENLFLTLPISLFVIFRYFHLVKSGSKISRHPEKVIKDKEIVVGVILWILLTFLILYKL